MKHISIEAYPTYYFPIFNYLIFFYQYYLFIYLFIIISSFVLSIFNYLMYIQSNQNFMFLGQLSDKLSGRRHLPPFGQCLLFSAILKLLHIVEPLNHWTLYFYLTVFSNFFNANLYWSSFVVMSGRRTFRIPLPLGNRKQLSLSSMVAAVATMCISSASSDGAMTTMFGKQAM